MSTQHNRDSSSSRSHQEPSRLVLLEPLGIAAGLTLAVSYRFLEPIWQVASGPLALGSLTSVAYLGGFIAYRSSAQRGIGRAILIAAVVSAPVLFTLSLLDLSVPRYTLVYELALLLAGLTFAAVRVPRALRGWAALLFLGFSAYPTLAGVGALGEPTPSLPDEDVDYVFTSYHDLNVTGFRVLERDSQVGGAMTLLPSGRVLLVAANGDARALDLSDGVVAAAMDLALPMNVSEYRAQVRDPTRYYRVTDVFYSDGHLFVTYTHWDPEEDCYTLRLIDAEFDETTVGPWATRFESRPCVGLTRVNNGTGGRMAASDASHLLLSVGHFVAEDYMSWSEWSESDYGKIHRLDRETWRSEVLTRGHRNAQGLVVSGDRIWSTEHGPSGGDELNRIEAGADYGWPFVSYGTDYGKKTLRGGGTPGDHSHFAAPTYTWTPSIAVSSLIEVTGDAFPSWRGDLLVGSLTGLGNGESLYRVRILEGRAVNVERIPMGRPVRDLLELPGGHIVLWDGLELIRVIRPADHVFAQCVGCHNVRDRLHGIGPDLADVVGSRIARHADYVYSEALRRYGREWTVARLDRFLEDPQGEVPGTTMEHAGIADPTQRAEIIEFLRDVSSARLLQN